MREQPVVERVQNSFDIEHLLTKVVHKQIADYFSEYGATIERKLGLTKDDIINDMREQIWKGLLTHNHKESAKCGQANLKTYLNLLIKNRFLLLYNRSTLKKYNSIDYYSDAFNATGISSEYSETEESGETLLEKRQELMKSLVLLSQKDRNIFKDLALGYNLSEMVERNKMPITEVIGSIKRIDETIQKRKLSAE